MKYTTISEMCEILSSENGYKYEGYDDVREFYSGNLAVESVISEGRYADGRRWFIVDGPRSEKTKIYEQVGA
jgi:hypothetical protein